MYENCTVIFSPRKIFGQWMVRKASVEIGDNKITAKFRKQSEVSVPAGTRNVLAYAEYMGQTCCVTMPFTFEPGKKYVVHYKTRFFVFLSGKIKIEMC